MTSPDRVGPVCPDPTLSNRRTPGPRRARIRRMGNKLGALIFTAAIASLATASAAQAATVTMLRGIPPHANVTVPVVYAQYTADSGEANHLTVRRADAGSVDFVDP